MKKSMNKQYSPDYIKQCAFVKSYGANKLGESEYSYHRHSYRNSCSKLHVILSSRRNEVEDLCRSSVFFWVSHSKQYKRSHAPLEELRGVSSEQ